jgi:hypothetical protein
VRRRRTRTRRMMRRRMKTCEMPRTELIIDACKYYWFLIA